MVDFRRHTRSARPVRTVPRVDSKGHLCGVISLPADVFRVSLRAATSPLPRIHSSLTFECQGRFASLCQRSTAGILKTLENSYKLPVKSQQRLATGFLWIKNMSVSEGHLCPATSSLCRTKIGLQSRLSSFKQAGRPLGSSNPGWAGERGEGVL